MNLWKSLEGIIEGELTGADPEMSLSAINARDIPLSGIIRVDKLTVRFLCSQRNWKTLLQISEKRGDSVRIIDETGLFYQGKALLRRPVLLCGLLFFLALTMFLPTRVLFFRVEGNKTISDRQILAAAEDCGIRFGISRRAVRSERMKNALLEAMPELKWAGINTSGCTAVISVRERNQQLKKTEDSGFGSIAAVRDGYVTSCTVTRGTALCSPGQVVKAGQILISGYSDCGIVLQATRASGEVYAETMHMIKAIAPEEWLGCSGFGEIRRRFRLIIGKKRINLWKGSGISPATCGRMYSEYYITLPGGFSLPVGIGVEILRYREFALVQQPDGRTEYRMKCHIRSRILEETVAGTILQENFEVSLEDGVYRMEGEFLCSEMIGRVITEEIGDIHGKTD